MTLDLIFTMRDIYINSNLNPLTKFTGSSRSTKFKDIFPWNIPQLITKTIPISTRIFISYAVKQASPFKFDGKLMETETITRSEFPNGEKATGSLTQEKICIQKISTKASHNCNAKS